MKQELVNFWKNVYQYHNNNVPQHWNEKTKTEYEEEISKEDNRIEILGINIPENLREHYDAVATRNITIPAHLTEHFDAITEVDIKIKHMTEPKVTKQKIIRCLKKIKTGKAAGLDGLKPDYYKAMLKNDTCIETLVKCYEKRVE